MPMRYFTQEEINPSEKTISLIRQIAYTYRMFRVNGRTDFYCLN